MFVTSVIIGVITDCLLMLTVRLRKHGPFILGDCKIISTAQRIISELASVGSRGQGSLAGLFPKAAPLRGSFSLEKRKTGAEPIAAIRHEL